MIRFTDVTKQFGSQTVLGNFSFEFADGQTYYIAGENGSGKSVILKLAVGLLVPDAGEVELDASLRLGKGEYPLDIGAIIDRPGFIADISGFDNLSYLASFRKKIGKEEIRRVMERVGLDPNSGKMVKKYSLGMKQRLAIAQAIMETPRVLILDEAFNGLDAEGKIILREIIAEYQARGALVILTSHSVEDIADVPSQRFRLENSRLIPLEAS